VTETVELVPKGGDLTVDNNNLPEYLDEQLKYRTLTRIQPQLAEFLKGFYDVVPEPFLSVFDFQVLDLSLICSCLFVCAQRLRLWYTVIHCGTLPLAAS
jgi:E3 ubiquitin-protein ligase NEDD4